MGKVAVDNNDDTFGIFRGSTLWRSVFSYVSLSLV